MSNFFKQIFNKLNKNNRLFKKKVSENNYEKFYILGIQIYRRKCKNDIINTTHDEITNLREEITNINNEIVEIKNGVKSISNELTDNKDLLKMNFCKLNRNLTISSLAANLHPKVFPKYRNCNIGKDIVILASGPTIDYYNLHQDALYLGVNRSFLANKAELDYLFIQDYIDDVQKDIDSYVGNNCKKFYGVHYIVPGIAQEHADIAGAERYYFIDCNPTYTVWAFPPDISMMPFHAYSSVVHPAVTFALWTGVKRIYLVGCDTNLNGYSKNMHYKDSNSNTLCLENVMYGWQKMREYASTFYPGTEIISINPVGLKGLFKDVYTREYLDEHPEINKEEIEILL